ncbi:MAG: hypothetical protein GOV15_03465, partial [Candidatus Diapherotrites archaeon]|nr:hypothetical protein [Candidatus Diapherotrites archaeon]
MTQSIIVPLVLAVLLSVVHYFSETQHKRIHKHHTALMSFSAGIFITFIFLEIFPILFLGAQQNNIDVFAFMLLGFVSFHLSEKYLYQHVTNKRKLLKEVTGLHIAG